MRVPVLFSICLLLGTLANCTPAQPVKAPLLLIASTPADSAIRHTLGIAQTGAIDFIRWKLALDTSVQPVRFQLDIHYGVGKNNTLGFEQGGTKRTLAGTCQRTYRRSMPALEFYSPDMGTPLVILQINADIYQILLPDNQLMKGNGGWSYTLNRVTADRSQLPKYPPGFTNHIESLPAEMVFDGRTPCSAFASAYHLNTHENCIKIKWRITLRSDPATGKPATCAIRRILREPTDLEGVWTVEHGLTGNPNAVIYKLQFEGWATLSVLCVDQQVLFLMDQENNLFVGDENFSYTYNRVK